MAHSAIVMGRIMGDKRRFGRAVATGYI